MPTITRVYDEKLSKLVKLAVLDMASIQPDETAVVYSTAVSMSDAVPAKGDKPAIEPAFEKVIASPLALSFKTSIAGVLDTIGLYDCRQNNLWGWVSGFLTTKNDKVSNTYGEIIKANEKFFTAEHTFIVVKHASRKLACVVSAKGFYARLLALLAVPGLNFDTVVSLTTTAVSIATTAVSTAVAVIDPTETA